MVALKLQTAFQERHLAYADQQCPDSSPKPGSFATPPDLTQPFFVYATTSTSSPTLRFITLFSTADATPPTAG